VFYAESSDRDDGEEECEDTENYTNNYLFYCQYNGRYVEAFEIHTGMIAGLLGPPDGPDWDVGSLFGPLFPPGGPDSLGDCRRTNASGRCIAMRKRA
jgi:hypothetical protein